MKKFKHLVFAGTFDRLHIGHKKLLDLAFELGERVSIGITTEKLFKLKPLANLIPTESVRRRAVEQYLRERKWLKRARFFRLEDIYGPSTTSTSLSINSLMVKPAFDSILVSKFTKENAEKINKIRIKRGLQALKIIVAPLVRGDDGKVVTSERIRMGEIDRNGNSYLLIVNSYLKKGKSELVLPKYLRKELRKPLGKVFKGSEDQLEETAKKVIKFIKFVKIPMVVAVGDIITESLLRVGFDPDVKIIDLRSRRKELEFRNQNFFASELASRLKSRPVAPRSLAESEGSLRRSLAQTSTRGKNFDCSNEPGTINIKAGKEIQKKIKNFILKGEKSWIVVKGEEDLLALPAVLFAPLNSVVLYGQMDLGVVVVKMTEEKKREVESILEKFV